MTLEEFEKEYRDRRIALESLREKSERLCRDVLIRENIPFVFINSRTKTLESAKSKFQRKGYPEPFSEMTDLVGIRIAVYLSSDVDQARELINKLFLIDIEKSVDKRTTQRPDSVGYRSLHLICSLGDDRGKLQEYHDIHSMPFEIQIRTALEHTWAEIEHKQNYKSAVALPEDLQRRLNILSGTLELVDRELAAIKNAADIYEYQLQKGDVSLEDDSISITSLRSIFKRIAQAIGLRGDFDHNDKALTVITQELNQFGIQTNKSLTEILAKNLTMELQGDADKQTISGFVRDAMIIENPRKYFEDVFQGDYQFQKSDIDIYRKLITNDDIVEIMMSAKVRFLDERGT